MSIESKTRCEWCLGDPLYITYHDEEWGVPVHDDRKHFEYILLDGMQAGLSWLTVLRKRENFRKAFSSFDPAVIAAYDREKIEDLLSDQRIIRNRQKIEATVKNAVTFMNIVEKSRDFDTFIWSFVNGQTIQNNWKTLADLPAQTKESRAMSTELYSRGFR
ncbi:MAG: DNA-3-methyladenine glycosylase I, partial [Candidatus Aminicenantes bacterium]|nr:DNA-3-methyladenine glycosylase I [Candidatus Aminicenantes bacterium]